MSRKKRTILAPRADGRLVSPEAVRAFERLGHAVPLWEPKTLSATGVKKLFALPPGRSGLAAHPDLFFSVNFHGLDKFGETFGAFREAGVPVAVWCVDNPWNLLSGLRSDFWKESFLFVTDPSFIPGLQAHGARHVVWLPLAADEAVFAKAKTAPEDARHTPERVVFVGRSSFPDKERFFVGQNVPEALLLQAASLLEQGARPDFFWWLDALDARERELWPGSTARRISLGAEETSLALRAACLHAAASLGLAVYGDEGWKNLIPPGHTPHVAVHPPLDYYTRLPAIYARAPFSLSMTSLLLPRGLNQRHFDVWAAGGFCLTDNTPGLELFPPELTEPVTFRTPGDIPDLVERFSRAPAEKTALAAAWRKHILAEHTYEARMRRLAETIFPPSNTS